MMYAINAFDSNWQFFPYRGMLDSTKNDHHKQNLRKEKSLLARRSKHLVRSIHEDEVNDTNDQLPHILDDNVHDFYEKVASSGELGLRDIFLIK